MVLYISDWSGSAPVRRQCRYSIRRIACIPHVLAMDVGQTFKVATSDQTAHNIHPLPNPMTGNIPWNQSQPPGQRRSRRAGKLPEVIPVQCNIHPWMHGWFVVVKGPYATTDHERRLHHQQRAARQLHGDCVAGRLGTQTAKGDGGRRSGGEPADFTFKAK